MTYPRYNRHRLVAHSCCHSTNAIGSVLVHQDVPHTLDPVIAFDWCIRLLLMPSVSVSTLVLKTQKLTLEQCSRPRSDKHWRRMSQSGVDSGFKFLVLSTVLLALKDQYSVNRF